MTTAFSNHTDQLAGLVYGSLAGDSLALGAHWIYDQQEILGTFRRVTDLLKPLADSYHPHKHLGEQTHYGDQALVLLDSLKARGGYDQADFSARWRKLWTGYNDYLDHATKETLALATAGGGGSSSEELGGAARLAPLLAALADQPLEQRIAAARSQTAVTHDSPIALDAAEYLTRIVGAILDGDEISRAIERAADGSYAILDPAELLSQVDSVKGLDAGAAAERLGLSCPAAKALPTVLALIQRFPDDLEKALIENVMAGGDSAARALALGSDPGRGSWEIGDPITLA